MKKLLCGFFGVAASAALAVESEVATVDVTAISSTLTNTVVAISVLDLSTGGDLAISNLVKTTNLQAGDKLYAFDNGNYECWTLSSGKVWEKSGVYTIGEDGELSAKAGTEASSLTMAVGKGIWLYRQNPVASNPFYVYGAHADTKTSIVPAGVSAELVGNPTQASAAPASIEGKASGDEVVVPTSGFNRRYKYNGTSWGYWDADERKEGFPSIDAGTGFWYIPKNKQAVTITW